MLLAPNFDFTFNLIYIDVWCTEINGHNAKAQWTPQFFRNIVVTDCIFVGNDEFVACNKFIKFVCVKCAQVVFTGQTKINEINLITVFNVFTIHGPSTIVLTFSEYFYYYSNIFHMNRLEYTSSAPIHIDRGPIMCHILTAHTAPVPNFPPFGVDLSQIHR